MDNFSSGQVELENQLFFCHLCKISCVSALNLQSHFLGFKHKKAEEALRNHGESDDQQTPTKAGGTLEDQINACKTTEPAVGLEYIYEFQNDDYSTFVCRLCSCRLGLSNMFMHIIGAKHKINYLSKHHPTMGISSAFQVTGPKRIKRIKKLKQACIAVEKKFGRKIINIVNGVYSPWIFTNDLEPAPSINYGPDSNLEKMDFTNEDFTGTDCKSTLRKRILTFQELKEANEADLKNATSCSGSLSQDSVDIRKDDHEHNEENDSVVDENSDHNKEVCNMELSYSESEKFTNNNEMIDFLDGFRILEGGDVAFLVKVTEKLANALARYNEKEIKKKYSSSAVSNENNKPMNQGAVPSLKHLHASQETTTNEQCPVSQPQVFDSSTQSSSPFPTHSAAEIHLDPENESNKQESPVSQFDKAGPPTETKQLVSCRSPSSVPQDSSTIDNQSQKVPAFKVCNEAPTTALRPDSPRETTTNSKNEQCPVSKSQVLGSSTQSTSSPFPTHSAAEIQPDPENESNKHESPVSQFDKAGPPTETKLVSCRSPTSVPQDSSTIDNQSQKVPAFKVCNEAPTSASRPDSPQETTTDSKDKQSLVSKSQVLGSSTQSSSSPFPTHSAAEIQPDHENESNKQESPVSQFDKAGPPTETKQLVSCRSPTSVPQDSSTFDNQSQKVPALKVDNEAPNSASRPDRPQESPNNYNQNQFPGSWFDNRETISGSHTSSLRASTKSLDPETKRKKQLFPVSQFNKAGPSIVTKPLVPSGLSSYFPKDSAAKGNQSQKFPAFEGYNKAPTCASGPDIPQDSASQYRDSRFDNRRVCNNPRPLLSSVGNKPQDSASHDQMQQYRDSLFDNRRAYINPRPFFSSVIKKPQDFASHDQTQQYRDSKFDNRTACVNPRPLFSPVGNKPPDCASHDQIQQYRNSKFDNRTACVNPRPLFSPVGNKPPDSASHDQIQQYRNSRFDNRRACNNPRPLFSYVVNKPQELKDQSFSSHQLNRGAPITQPRYPFPSGHSSHMSPDQQFNFMAHPQKNSSAPPRAPFPHELLNNTAAKPLLPGLPMANDDITAKFFESIKTMDVSEVISSLNSLTASNPAFKGINVPSLVRYLTETGKLKSSSSIQQLTQ
ncbi:uncharacterized protein LOC142158612 isoform X3 [Mixophyes fleayi]|uniref:uncharacterized protein LOC142158612 isoform X3 n=1 Tax=Mixophyes fleayi TaxID=3061075 RepID=UPI003F4E1B33